MHVMYPIRAIQESISNFVSKQSNSGPKLQGPLVRPSKAIQSIRRHIEPQIPLRVLARRRGEVETTNIAPLDSIRLDRLHHVSQGSSIQSQEQLTKQVKCLHQEQVFLHS